MKNEVLKEEVVIKKWSIDLYDEDCMLRHTICIKTRRDHNHTFVELYDTIIGRFKLSIPIEKVIDQMLTYESKWLNTKWVLKYWVGETFARQERIFLNSLNIDVSDMGCCRTCMLGEKRDGIHKCLQPETCRYTSMVYMIN